MNIILYNSKKLEDDVSLNVLKNFIKENNFIENVNRTGIWLGGQWFNRYKKDSAHIAKRIVCRFHEFYTLA